MEKPPSKKPKPSHLELIVSPELKLMKENLEKTLKIDFIELANRVEKYILENKDPYKGYFEVYGKFGGQVVYKPPRIQSMVMINNSNNCQASEKLDIQF